MGQLAEQLDNLIRDNQVELFNRERQLFFNPGCLEDIRPDHIERYQLAYSLSMRKDDKILDISCGAGYSGLIFKEQHYWGIDKSSYAIKMAKLCVVPFRDGSRVTCFMEKDIADIIDPASKNEWPRFDCITCFETFEHLEEKLHRPFLQFLQTILGGDGELFISCPLIGPDNEMHSIAGHHKKEYGLLDLKSLLQEYFPVFAGSWVQSWGRPIERLHGEDALYKNNYSFPGPRGVRIITYRLQKGDML